jgi:hypothetical protein
MPGFALKELRLPSGNITRDCPDCNLFLQVLIADRSIRPRFMGIAFKLESSFPNGLNLKSSALAK